MSAIQLLTTQNSSLPTRMPLRRSLSLQVRISSTDQSMSPMDTINSMPTVQAPTSPLKRRHSLTSEERVAQKQQADVLNHLQTSLALLKFLHIKKSSTQDIPTTIEENHVVTEEVVTEAIQNQLLSQKPRGILKRTSQEEMREARLENEMETNKQQHKSFRFNETVLVGETFAKEEYTRKSDFVLHLTPQLAQMIKKELNDFKTTDMDVHVESRQYTHLYTM